MKRQTAITLLALAIACFMAFGWEAEHTDRLRDNANVGVMLNERRGLIERINSDSANILILQGRIGELQDASTDTEIIYKYVPVLPKLVAPINTHVCPKCECVNDTIFIEQSDCIPAGSSFVVNDSLYYVSGTIGLNSVSIDSIHAFIPSLKACWLKRLFHK